MSYSAIPLSDGAINKLIARLEEVYRPLIINPTMDINKIMFEAGKLEVVNFVKAYAKHAQS